MATRLLELQLPKATLTRFSGVEALSQPFEFKLTIISSDPVLFTQDSLGEGLGFSVQDGLGAPERFFHGQIDAFAPVLSSELDQGVYHYQLTLRPAMYALSYASDCRVFTHKAVPEIVLSVLKAHGIYTVDLAGLHDTYAQREYCVQYNETDFAFISRLLEEEGIFYYFNFSAGQHTLVLGDHVAAYRKCVHPVVCHVEQQARHYVSDWWVSESLTNTRYVLRSYQVADPSSNPEGEAVMAGEDFPIYAFDTTPNGDLTTQAKKRLASLQVKQANACGNDPAFQAGLQFKLDYLLLSQENGTYVLTEVEHLAVDESHCAQENPVPRQYTNTFTAIFAERVFRPKRVHRKPKMDNIQSAWVVGVGDVDADELMRVKLRFPWDRENTVSKRVRVSQWWSGKGYGTQFTPWVGEEVVVDFFQGDPDQPFVIGALYNKKNQAPYDDKKVSGIKTATGHTLEFDDTPEKACVTLASSGALIEEIGGTLRHQVGGKQHVVVDGPQQVTVKQAYQVCAKAFIELRAGSSFIRLEPEQITIAASAIHFNSPHAPSAAPSGAMTAE